MKNEETVHPKAVEGDRRRAVILVGHGAIPTDYPWELVTKQKALEAKRRALGGAPTAEEMELDRRIRRWPRTPENDPYKSGLEALAEHFTRCLNGDLFGIAYNEFCAPTLEDTVEELIARGVHEIRVVPSMLTPGGAHSELEIPETLACLCAKHPGIRLIYAWPFDLHQVASMLAGQVSRF